MNGETEEQEHKRLRFLTAKYGVQTLPIPVEWEDQTFEEWEELPERTLHECIRDNVEYHRMKDFSNSSSRALYESFTTEE